MVDERLTDEELAILAQTAEDADWSNKNDTTGWHTVELEAEEAKRLLAEVRASRLALEQARGESNRLRSALSDAVSSLALAAETHPSANSRSALRQLADRADMALNQPAPLPKPPSG